MSAFLADRNSDNDRHPLQAPKPRKSLRRFRRCSLGIDLRILVVHYQRRHAKQDFVILTIFEDAMAAARSTSLSTSMNLESVHEMKDQGRNRTLVNRTDVSTGTKALYSTQ